MEFQIGDAVFHPVHGIGHIVSIAERHFTQDQARLYYEITTEKSTVWMPIESSGVIGLRRVTSKHELTRYRNILKSKPAPLNDDHGKRRLELTNQLKTSSFEVVCQIVRDLTARSRRKRLTQLDTVTLRKARGELEQEWSAAAGIPLTDAEKEIDALLLEGQRRFAT